MKRRFFVSALFCLCLTAPLAAAGGESAHTVEKDTWTVTAEFDALTGPVPTDPPGTGDCADVLGVVDPAAFPLACETATVVTECQPPGTYWFFVAPVFGDLVPCQTNTFGLRSLIVAVRSANRSC